LLVAYGSGIAVSEATHTVRLGLTAVKSGFNEVGTPPREN